MKTALPLLLLWVIFQGRADAQEASARWTAGKANAWYTKQPWLCGLNYIPTYAINYTAMWDKTSFDPKAIDRELALAEKTGMNVLRVVLQYAVYADDPEYFLKTFNTFLSISEKHKITVVPALFDDCVFGINHDPKLGKQPEPLKGWYAWAWSPSPGHSMVTDTTSYPKLENYAKTIVGHFRNDKRVLFWDVYNEPTNGGLGTTSLPLLKKIFAAVRLARPEQPISAGIFDRNERLNTIITDSSDIITFHNYGDRKNLEEQINALRKFGRPVINTEWMNRPSGSTIADNLAVFARENVGCMLWGLVNGKTQTHLPWGHRPGDPEPKVWQHDLFRSNFSAYDPAEIATIKETIRLKATRKN